MKNSIKIIIILAILILVASVIGFVFWLWHKSDEIASVAPNTIASTVKKVSVETLHNPDPLIVTDGVEGDGIDINATGKAAVCPQVMKECADGSLVGYKTGTNCVYEKCLNTKALGKGSSVKMSLEESLSNNFKLLSRSIDNASIWSPEEMELDYTINFLRKENDIFAHNKKDGLLTKILSVQTGWNIKKIRSATESHMFIIGAILFEPKNPNMMVQKIAQSENYIYDAKQQTLTTIKMPTYPHNLQPFIYDSYNKRFLYITRGPGVGQIAPVHATNYSGEKIASALDQDPYFSSLDISFNEGRNVSLDNGFLYISEVIDEKGALSRLSAYDIKNDRIVTPQ